MNKIRPIAFYLPQFHPVPENDEWWGKGFTEWTNVTRVTPQFPGHYQPHLPADFGFYDLRLHETLIEQASLAKEYGIYGFMFYHYWFNGRRLLETPVNAMLLKGTPDFPFCLCWANENWTRTWEGGNNQILLEQKHSIEDDIEHMKYLCTIFKDKRYIRVNDKPVFAVYRTEIFPDIHETANTWREIARSEGIKEIYLVRVESFKSGIDPHDIGFDAAIEFQPDWRNLPDYLKEPFNDKLFRHLKRLKGERMINAYGFNGIFNYEHVIQKMIAKPKLPYKVFPGATPQWDNSARKKTKAIIFHQSTPELFKKWLLDIKKKFIPFSKDENFLFINAWNEWAEGNHLEPDQKWGRAYLEVVKEVFGNDNK